MSASDAEGTLARLETAALELAEAPDWEATGSAFLAAMEAHATAPESEHLAHLLARAEQRGRDAQRAEDAALVRRWAAWYHEQMVKFEATGQHQGMVLVNDRYCTNTLGIARWLEAGREPPEVTTPISPEFLSAVNEEPPRVAAEGSAGAGQE